ncbi:MAG: hypothetical protein WCB68_12510 [Pyrinomonadaceae bacterium]
MTEVQVKARVERVNRSDDATVEEVRVSTEQGRNHVFYFGKDDAAFGQLEAHSEGHIILAFELPPPVEMIPVEEEKPEGEQTPTATKRQTRGGEKKS